jgi:hypothetical protein
MQQHSESMSQGMGQGAMASGQIKEHMPVVCSNNKQFATVDRLEGNAIKLTRDAQGQHHWIPLAWVERVDEQVHIDRPGDQAMREWMSNPPGM